MTWAEAFLRQAESDFQVFRLFSTPKSKVAVCHRLHFLQMATEKLAKSFLVTSANIPPKRSDFALVRFLRVLSSNPDIRARMKFGNSPKQFKAYIDSLVPVAERIEALAPIGDEERVNPEYPWMDRRGRSTARLSTVFQNSPAGRWFVLPLSWIACCGS